MRCLVAGLLLLALAASGCSDHADASGPPEIVYGRDLCIECGMLITEERFAAAYWYEGEARRFDDIGGMLLHGSTSGELAEASEGVWVHDRDTRAWIYAADAWYVLADGIVTPMGYGLVAFTTLEDAQEYATDRSGTILTWTDLFSFSIEPGKLTHDHQDHDGS